MFSGTSFAQIYTANGMGVLLCVMMLFELWQRSGGTQTDHQYIRFMLVCTIISCIADPFSFYVIDRPGIVSRIVNYITSTWLFLCPALVGPPWIALVSRHVNGSNSKGNRRFCLILSTISLALLTLNLFYPVAFRIDANNAYSRGPLFIVYNLIAAIFMLDGIMIYIQGRRRGGVLKFFPVIQFILPSAIGLILQACFYGISTIWPCVAVSIACLVISLQKETIYCDRLTGLYNRFYLDIVRDDLQKARSGSITAIMMDMI